MALLLAAVAAAAACPQVEGETITLSLIADRWGGLHGWYDDAPVALSGRIREGLVGLSRVGLEVTRAAPGGEDDGCAWLLERGKPAPASPEPPLVLRARTLSRAAGEPPFAVVIELANEGRAPLQISSEGLSIAWIAPLEAAREGEIWAPPSVVSWWTRGPSPEAQGVPADGAPGLRCPVPGMEPAACAGAELPPGGGLVWHLLLPPRDAPADLWLGYTLELEGGGSSPIEGRIIQLP